VPHVCAACRLLYLDEALARQFTTAVRVGKRSKEAGKTIAEVGLRGINGEPEGMLLLLLLLLLRLFALSLADC
jgi:hypothetical protein